MACSVNIRSGLVFECLVPQPLFSIGQFVRTLPEIFCEDESLPYGNDLCRVIGLTWCSSDWNWKGWVYRVEYQNEPIGSKFLSAGYQQEIEEIFLVRGCEVAS